LPLLRACWAWRITLKNYKMSEIKERIFANWKTTTLGVAVLIAGLVLVYLEKASMAELTAFVSGALVLLISKDGK
jgi:multisubunit Na+/H+ antiporter MnhG subunit